MTGAGCFNRSEEFGRAVDLLLKMAEIPALCEGWVVFNAGLNPDTAHWYKTNGESCWGGGLGAAHAQVPPDGLSRPEAIADLTRGLVFAFEELELMARNVAPEDVEVAEDFRSRAQRLREHLFSPAVEAVAG